MNGCVVVDLDELGQLRLLGLDVDERVAVVVEDAEEPVDADVDARRLQQRRRRTGRSRSSPRRAGGRSSRRRAPSRRFLRGSSSARELDIVAPWQSRARSSFAPRFPAPALARSPSGRSAWSPIRSASTSRSWSREGRGAIVTDVDGNTFVDFTGGVGCLNVGHAHPRVVAAVQEQAARFFHTDFTIVPYEVYVEYAERLLARRAVLRPGEGRVLQRRHRGRRERRQVRARLHEAARGDRASRARFHGRTLLSLTLTSKTHPYKAGLGPFAPEVYRVPFPDEYRGITDAPTRSTALERAFSTQVAAETVAAIVVEPVQGEGGFIAAPQEFIEGLRRICDREGILLVVDEVQTGFGRTGQDVRDRALRRRARPDDGREVDRRRPAALGRRRQGRDHGLPLGQRGRRHVRRQSRSRSRPRLPSSTCSRRRDSSSARSGSARRSAHGCSRGRSATTRSATCAGSARCSRSSTSRTARRKSRRRAIATRVAEEAAEARAAPAQGGHPLELQPRPLPARHHGRRARGSARRVGRRAGSGPRVAALAFARSGGVPARGRPSLPCRGRRNRRPDRRPLRARGARGKRRHVDACSARTTASSSGASRSRSSTSTSPRTASTSSASATRRARSRSSRTRTSSPSSTAARTTAASTSSSSSSTARTSRS